MRELSHYSLEHEILANDIAVVVFFAPWCETCKGFATVLEDAAENHPEIFFGTVNADREPELARRFDLKAVPTLVVFREKIMVFRETGAPPPPILEEVLRQVVALDMEKVRADLQQA